MSATIVLRILSPAAHLYEDEVSSITAENNEGLFDILPDHARFMSLLKSGPFTIHMQDGNQKTVNFDTALLFFRDNTATVYVQEPLEKIAL